MPHPETVTLRSTRCRAHRKGLTRVAVGRIHMAVPGFCRGRFADLTVPGRGSPVRKEGTSMKEVASLNMGSKYDPRLRALILPPVNRKTSPPPRSGERRVGKE